MSRGGARTTIGISLISDKSSYVPGETARILIPSPYQGEHWALVTIERGGILRHELVKITSNSQIYELPITSDLAPNVYVSGGAGEGPGRDE